MTNLETRKTYAVIDNPLNKRLISKLKEKGEEVLIFPPLQTYAADLNEKAVEFIGNPSSFEWLIFTDVFAADFFIEAMRRLETDFFVLDDLTVCALGEAVADRLRFDRIHSDVVPPNSTDETVFSAISQYAGGEIDGVGFLLLCEASKNFGFIEMLRNENAAIEKLPIYRAEFNPEADLTRLKTLLKGGAVDEFVFSSAEDVAALKTLFPESSTAAILNEMKISATNEIAFQTLQENELRPLYFHYK
jgi:uroporphyrinogen-III synthase